jgi:nitrite reductase/ring-hydroxylating ferredoxin subunit
MKLVGPASSLPRRTITGVGGYAVGNNGSADKDHYFAVGRRCRHLGADLANGAIAKDGCLVCPWHGAKYDVSSGRMVRGPQGIFAKVPGLGAVFKGISAVVPLGRAKVVKQGDDLYLDL